MSKPLIVEGLIVEGLGDPSNPAGGTVVIIRHLIVPLTLAVFAVHAVEVRAQGAFPAPLPGALAPPGGDPAFPPVNGAAPAAVIGGPSAFPTNGAPPVSGGVFQPRPQAGAPARDEGMNGFLPGRQEGGKNRAVIQAPPERAA